MSAANNVLSPLLLPHFVNQRFPVLPPDFLITEMPWAYVRRILKSGFRLARFEFQAECTLDAWLAARKSISEDDVCATRICERRGPSIQ